MPYSNSVQNAGSEVAALVVERAIGGTRGTVASLLVQPAIWAATRTVPDAADTFIYAAGALGTIAQRTLLSVPGMITGAWKGYLDDRTQQLVDEAKQDEPATYRRGIAPLGDYNFWASNNHNQAMTIASAGGVVWKHPNGALMFIRDARGLLVCDYEPAKWREIYRPVLPLQDAPTGRGVRWTHRRK